MIMYGHSHTLFQKNERKNLNINNFLKVKKKDLSV